MPQGIMNQSEEKMKKSISSLKKDLTSLRAGRATPALLDNIQADYYGAPTPINQLANISTPEPRQLTIQPWDKGAMEPIEKAIQKSDLGLTPNNDGGLIRIIIPALTEERRAELKKLVKKYGEEAKVAVRNVRRDANDDLKKKQKDGDITEDDLHRHQDNVQEMTDKYIKQVDELVSEKENEIMEV